MSEEPTREKLLALLLDGEDGVAEINRVRLRNRIGFDSSEEFFFNEYLYVHCLGSANLASTDLSKANLSEANLTGAIGSYQSKLNRGDF